MTHAQYALNQAFPKFSIDENSLEGKQCLDEVPVEIWNVVNVAKDHEGIVRGYDMIADWMKENIKNPLAREGGRP